MKLFKRTALAAAMFVFVLSGSVSSLFAQGRDTTKTKMPLHNSVLKGRVMDAQTTDAISDASIFITGKNDSTITDQDGKFEIAELSAGIHGITVKADGYQVWNKKLTLGKQTRQLTIKLQPKL